MAVRDGEEVAYGMLLAVKQPTEFDLRMAALARVPGIFDLMPELFKRFVAVNVISTTDLPACEYCRGLKAGVAQGEINLNSVMSTLLDEILEAGRRAG